MNAPRPSFEEQSKLQIVTANRPTRIHERRHRASRKIPLQIAVRPESRDLHLLSIRSVAVENHAPPSGGLCPFLRVPGKISVRPRSSHYKTASIPRSLFLRSRE